MSFNDFLDRKVSISAGGDTFTVRPIRVRDWHALVFEMHGLMAALGQTDPESISSHQSALEAAQAASDEAAAESAIASMFLAVFGELKGERLSRVYSLFCEGGRERDIRYALERDGLETGGKFLAAIHSLHDVGRMVRMFRDIALAAGKPAVSAVAAVEPTGPVPGLETQAIEVCSILTAYRIEDVLDWPFERLVSTVEQLGLIGRSHRGNGRQASRAGAGAAQKVASASQLRSRGAHVYAPTPKAGKAN